MGQGELDCAKVLSLISYPLYGNGKGMHGLCVPLPLPVAPYYLLKAVSTGRPVHTWGTRRPRM